MRDNAILQTIKYISLLALGLLLGQQSLLAQYTERDRRANTSSDEFKGLPFYSDEKEFKRTKEKVFYVFGRVYRKSNGKTQSGATVKLYENGVVIGESLSDSSGKFKLELPVDNSYIIKVSHNGCYAKNVAVKTSISKKSKYASYGFRFNIELIDTFPGKDTLAQLEKPVAIIEFAGDDEGFGYKEPYTTKALEQVAQRVKVEEQRVYAQKGKTPPPPPVAAKEELVAIQKAVMDDEKKEAPKQAPEVEKEEIAVYPEGITEEMVFETRRTVKRTIIKDPGKPEVVFQLVTYAWGGIFYFKNNATISKPVYDVEIEAAKKKFGQVK